MVASSGLAQVINYSCSISYRPGPQDQILSRPRAARRRWRPYASGTMQDLGCELARMPLLL